MDDYRREPSALEAKRREISEEWAEGMKERRRKIEEEREKIEEEREKIREQMDLNKVKLGQGSKIRKEKAQEIARMARRDPEFAERLFEAL